MYTSWIPRVAKFASYPVFRKLVLGVLSFTAYGAAQYAFVKYHPDLSFEFPPGVHTMMGLTLSILLVFRTNATYDRWWEARRLWGSLTNSSRALGQVVGKLSVPEDEKREFARAQRQLPFDLREHLRAAQPPDIHHPLRLTDKMADLAEKWLQAGHINALQWPALEMRISALLDVIGGCERIRHTPLPLSHRAAIPQVLLAYLLILPWGLPHNPTSILIVAAATYFVLSLELIAEELEEPFGTEPDDLPLSRYSSTIARSLEQLYGGLLVKEDSPT